MRLMHQFLAFHPRCVVASRVGADDEEIDDSQILKS